MASPGDEVECSRCGELYDGEAEACPNCGHVRMMVSDPDRVVEIPDPEE